MRKTILVMAMALGIGPLGCSSGGGPVVVTPEIEAQQKQAEKDVRSDELLNQKKQKVVGKGSAEDEERQRQRTGGN